ncbi:putative LRR receptor-like serine/threonine-protein kinase-like [Dorcoceras hygrometricum]|uniref:Putative LRR receptor-like serine/threonine-protein kinase-like n=1 Tax=Dorcoceras hygrometricum TaxID=472368 RepID=A0A2Z7D8Y3_9LAMI|nr:putative LRR receptor-like serine/threonine-protein kinase-like [Dorcoceras hygrometricum]
MLVQEQPAQIRLVRKGSDLTLTNRRDVRSDQTKMRKVPLEDFDYTSECTTHSAGSYSLPKAEILDSTPALCCVHSITSFMPQKVPLEDFDYTSECTTHSAGSYSLPKAEILDSTPALCCVHSITSFMPQ